MRQRRNHVVALAAILVPFLATAQEGAVYRITESVLNSGGDPLQGVVLASPTYRVTLDSLGEIVAARISSGSTFAVQGGFVAAFPAPGEVLGTRFVDEVTIRWDPDHGALTYTVYRDSLLDLGSGATGVCLQSDLRVTEVLDVDLPPPEDGYFYLVTAINPRGEEGTPGFDSADEERPDPQPCP